MNNLNINNSKSAENVSAAILSAITDAKETNPNATIGELKGFLKFNGFKDKDVKKVLEEEGIAKGKAKTFASDFYDWLVEGDRDAEEVEAYILGEGEYGDTSDNVKKHKAHYTNIAEFAARIRAGL
jgi:hypothetical protein